MTEDKQGLFIAKLGNLAKGYLDQVVGAGLPMPVLEVRVIPSRRWHYDFYWPSERVAAEVDGATWIQGRHTRPQGFANDCDKTNEGQLTDVIILRFTKELILDGRALDQTKRALAKRAGHSLGPFLAN